MEYSKSGGDARQARWAAESCKQQRADIKIVLTWPELPVAEHTHFSVDDKEYNRAARPYTK
jgi:hypothetical protein